MARRMVSVRVVDAFTSVPFSGNPAGVVLLEKGGEGDEAPEGWMQQLAGEMRHSETAFVREREEGGGEFDLRWFTPEAEVELCGHATLGAAHVLFEERGELREVGFHTKSGRLRCVRAGMSSGGRVEMDFPALSVEGIVAPEGLGAALGVRAVFVGRSKFDLMVEVRTEREVRECKPDMRKLIAVETRGVIVVAGSLGGGGGMYDVVSRFFAPRVGVDEDPVTGSAHCVIGPYFAGKLGKSELRCYQASERGGIVNLRVEGERGGRVALGGEAVTVLRGEVVGWKG